IAGPGGDRVVIQRGPFPGPLGSLLDRVNGPNEFPALVAFQGKDFVPRRYWNPLHQPVKDLLGTIGPAIRVEPGVPPASCTVALNVRDGLGGTLGANGVYVGDRKRGAEHDGHDDRSR